MDCVRTALRLRPEGEVYCVYRRTEAEMPGREEERHHAHEEGVHFEFLTLPKRFLGNQRGEVATMECVRMRLGEPDAKGRRRPVELPGTEFTMEVDTVVLALGYNVDPEIGESTPELRVAKWGTVWVETESTGQTSRQDIWAAGDNVRGADLVVTAVAAARKAAGDIDRALRARPPKKSLPPQ
jgi:glutamate synthase (NADPH/NADH) small chain